MKIYAMSDIHGCIHSFLEALQLVDLSGDNQLVLCGDYIHGVQDDYLILDLIKDLEMKHGSDKVIVLAGNHEDMACDGRWPIGALDIRGSVLIMTMMINTFYGCKDSEDIM